MFEILELRFESGGFDRMFRASAFQNSSSKVLGNDGHSSDSNHSNDLLKNQTIVWLSWNGHQRLPRLQHAVHCESTVQTCLLTKRESNQGSVLQVFGSKSVAARLRSHQEALRLTDCWSSPFSVRIIAHVPGTLFRITESVINLSGAVISGTLNHVI